MKKILIIGLFLFSAFAGHAQDDTTWNAKFILTYGPYTDTVYFGCSTAASDGLDTFDVIDTNYSYRSQPIGIRSGIDELNSQYGCANLKRNYKSFEQTDQYGAIKFNFYAYVHQDFETNNYKLYLDIDTSDFLFSMPPYISRTGIVRSVNGYVGAIDGEYTIFYDRKYKDEKFFSLPIELLKETFLVGCSNPTLFKFTLSTGIGIPNYIAEDNHLGRLEVFPNPTNGYVTIKPSNAVISFSVIDLYGRIHFENRCIQDDLGIDLSHLPDNLYILIFTDKDGATVSQQKIILKR